MRPSGSRWRLPARLTAIAGILVGVLAWPTWALGGRDGLHSMLLGAALSLLTIVASYAVLVFAFRNAKQIQMVIVVGGFVLRMALLFGLLAWIARSFVVDLDQLVIWLVSFYLVLVVAEGYELAAQVRNRDVPRN